MEYASFVVRKSELASGVEFVIARMSFGRRMELTRRIRELAQQAEYFKAGPAPREQMEAALLASEIDRTYVEWGLAEVRGLRLDGEAATPQKLVEQGPEDLFREALEAVKRECGLSEDERKN